MECGDLVAAVKRGGELPAGGPDHLAACDACRAVATSDLARALGPGAATGPAPSLETIRATLDRERGPLAWLRSRPTWARLALAARVAATVVVLTPLLGHGLRADLARWPVPRLALALGLLAGLGGASVAIALRPVHFAAVSRGRVLLLLGAGAFIQAGLALLPAPHEGVPTAPGDHCPTGIECWCVGTLLGLPLLFIAVAAAHLPNALLGAAAAGLLGNVVLQLGCPSIDASHLLAGHATIVPALVAAAHAASRGRA